jgi:hypothetical protein
VIIGCIAIVRMTTPFGVKEIHPLMYPEGDDMALDMAQYSLK